MKRAMKFLKEEKGTAESALVFIPLLVLFLVGFQLSIAAHTRNSALVDAQAAASAKAISGDFEADDEFIHIDTSGDGQNLDLLVTKKQVKLVDLLPGFLGGHSSNRGFELRGLAIVENRR